MSSQSTVRSGHAATLTIDADRRTHRVSPTLFGLFFEDLNYGLDGGLNANLVNNHSFEAVYLDRRGHNLLRALVTKRAPRRVPDLTRHWHVTGGKLVAVDRTDVPGAHAGRLTSFGAATVVNHGYPGGRAGMGARAGTPLEFAADVRLQGFEGDVRVQLVDLDGAVVADALCRLSPTTADWQSARASLLPSRTGLVSLRITADGAGALDLDEVRLVPSDHWGAGDSAWSQGVLRRDLVEAIRDAAPTFLRFPGGCVVEGMDARNAYRWKDTVGPLVGRRGDFNLWALHVTEGDYHQSHQVGFYEFFLLCEDLGITPLPVINAGLACQGRSKHVCAIASPDFDSIVTDALDLVEWATGDPATSRWAALRAEAGHPEPFKLDVIGIGNENLGPEYTERFRLIREALLEKRPELKVVLSAGMFPAGKGFEHSWELARSADLARPEQVLVDEHFYKSPRWVETASSRYDSYPRGGARVFVGEYAAHPPTLMTPRPFRPAANSFASALGEAALYTGLVRNSDVVAMSCYAPLFNLVGHGQWEHDFLDFNPFVVQPTLNYWVQQLFTASLGESVVEVDGALPDRLYVCATRDESALFLHLVNAAEAHREVTLHCPGVSATGTTRSIRSSQAIAPDLKYTDLGATGSPVRDGSTNIVEGVGVIHLDPQSVTLLRVSLG